MTEPRVAIAIEAGVAEVRLSRPDKLNALDPAMFEGIVAAIAELAALPELRAVVLHGEGRAFCAGLDMATMAASGSAITTVRDRTHGHANLYQQVAWGWRTLAVPVIAAAHGVAFGGGLQILAGADIKIAAPGTRFSIMELKWGLVPDMAGMALWHATVRDDVLRELVYTAREFTAAEAVQLGFVTRLADDPLADARTLARAIANRNPHAIRGAKRLLNRAIEAAAPATLQAESDEQAKVMMSPNQIEAVRANLEKRAPKFSD